MQFKGNYKSYYRWIQSELWENISRGKLLGIDRIRVVVNNNIIYGEKYE